MSSTIKVHLPHPSTPMRYKLFLTVVTLAGLWLASPAIAQLSQSRPVVLVSPFPAGSGSDLVARAVSPGLAQALGQPVVVENKPGAGGAIGAQFVARAKPDGHTLFLASLSFSVLPSLTRALPSAVSLTLVWMLMGRYSSQARASMRRPLASILWI